MRKRILAYIKYMNDLLKRIEASSGKDMEPGVSISREELERIKAEHLTQIAFFQHERLVHLIVMVLFAILEFLSLFLCMLVPGVGTLLLTVAVLILLIPYIKHYYLLENEVQRMYSQYDRIQALLDRAAFRMI